MVSSNHTASRHQFPCHHLDFDNNELMGKPLINLEMCEQWQINSDSAKQINQDQERKK